MTSRGVIFKAEMVQAIQNTSPDRCPKDEGKPAKWVTRRILSEPWAAFAERVERRDPAALVYLGSTPTPAGARQPPARKRDRLWVREGWAVAIEYDVVPPRDLVEGVAVWYRAGGGRHLEDLAKAWLRGRWRSPIHLPRKLARIELEVEDVQVERLQTISADHLVGEGFVTSAELGDQGEAAARLRFAEGWDGINGSGSWRSNPWVWVISFRRIEPLRASVSDDQAEGC